MHHLIRRLETNKPDGTYFTVDRDKRTKRPLAWTFHGIVEVQNAA
jgi:hypothetical protein